MLVAQMRQMGVHSFVLVTSDYHTRRAGYLFHTAGPELKMYVVASPDTEFRLDRWWKNREGRKFVLTEWLKTVATYLGM